VTEPVGLAHLPSWDIEASVAELHWAALTHDELTEPLDEVPGGASPFAFRTNGPWD
jgi:hypothetical protein